MVHKYQWHNGIESSDATASKLYPSNRRYWSWILITFIKEQSSAKCAITSGHNTIRTSPKTSTTCNLLKLWRSWLDLSNPYLESRIQIAWHEGLKVGLHYPYRRMVRTNANAYPNIFSLKLFFCIRNIDHVQDISSSLVPVWNVFVIG